MLRRALPASLALHLLVAALLMLGVPEWPPLPQEEEAISVELVPPPPEPPPPPAQKPPPPPAQAPQPAGNDAARDAPIPVLKPVFQFGEKDAGPRLSPDGNSAEDASAAPAAPREPDKPDLAQPPPVTPVKATSQSPQPGASETPAPRPEDAAKAQSASKLRQAKVLFSLSETGSPIATRAMGDISRGVRAGQLCTTELAEQLLHASPPFFPELLPLDQLREGTVLENPGAAFSANRQWYDLAYRCVVDPDATKVVSFAFDVGHPIPPSQWKRRGLSSP